MSGWRNWTFLVGAILMIAGIAMVRTAGGPMVLILGALTLVSAALEPIYGRANGTPRGDDWQATPERFVDPETGKLVAVWFDPRTGERRYVEEAEGSRST